MDIETVDQAAWSRALDEADKFMQEARKHWVNFSNRPWNKIAMHHVLAQFAYHLVATPAKGESNG